MRIFLIGFMASGKSTIGQELADALQFDFLDMDQMIEIRTGQSITEIFDRQGPAVFRQLETELLTSHLPTEKVVIATGGGTPCFNDNITLMNTLGYTVFLDVSIDILCQRLTSEKAHRPLIAHLEAESLRTFIEHKLHERKEFYS